MTAALAIETVLDEALLTQGFARPRRATSWRRADGAVEHVVGLRRSRTGGRSAAVHFAEVAPGAPHDGVGFELSPVAPLSNTHWWPASLSPAEALALRAQVTQLVLPFFAAPAWDAADAQRLVRATLAPLCHAEPGFACADDGTWWRERGRVIDMVIPEPLALHRFVRLWVAVWHRDLHQGLSGPVPEDVTHAAAHTLGLDGLEGAPLLALFALAAPQTSDAWPQVVPRLLPAALQWFDTVHSAADVLAQVREEYRAMMAWPV